MPLWVTVNGLLLLGAYLLGSIPTGYLAGRILKGIDIRQHGSGSTGATNVLRTLGKGPGAAVLLFDVLKGTLAVLLARWVYGLSFVGTIAPPSVSPPAWLPWMVTLAGLAALLGHSASIWINFTGGKSVAAGLGVLLAMYYPAALATLAVFTLFLAVSRIVSLSSIAGAIAVSGFMLAMGQPLPYQILAIAGGLYVVWKHRSNIQRLLNGTEPRLGQKTLQEPEQAVEGN